MREMLGVFSLLSCCACLDYSKTLWLSYYPGYGDAGAGPRDVRREDSDDFSLQLSSIHHIHHTSRPPPTCQSSPLPRHSPIESAPRP